MWQGIGGREGPVRQRFQCNGTPSTDAGDNHPKELIRSILLRGSGRGGTRRRWTRGMEIRAGKDTRESTRPMLERTMLRKYGPEREPGQPRKIVTLIIVERRARDALRDA